MKNIIKTNRDRNKYLLTNNKYWVRDFTQPYQPRDVNKFYSREDVSLLVNNEINNLNKGYSPLELDIFKKYKKYLIVSDGISFDQHKILLKDLKDDVFLICVNRTLNKWIFNEKGQAQRRINLYLVNNPYPQCLSYLPNKNNNYFPRCLASIRTDCNFLLKYKGDIQQYSPPFNRSFGTRKGNFIILDDYRNSVCAAVSLINAISNVDKVALFCCSDGFGERREAMLKVKDGLWMHQQQIVSHEIIDSCLYWLNQKENSPEVVDFSFGMNYENAKQENVSELLNYFSS